MRRGEVLAGSKTALVTGASRGIGRCYAQQLAAMGYNVLMVASGEEELLATASEVRELRIKPRSSWTKQETAFYDFVRCCFYFGENKRYRDSAYSFFFDLGQPVIQELGFPENTETLLRTKQKEPR